MKEDNNSLQTAYTNVAALSVSIDPVQIIKRSRSARGSRLSLQHTRRAYARIYSRVDIVISEDHSDVCYKAVMLSQSAGGLCFESPRPLAPKTMIRIKIRNSAETSASRAAEIYRAEVVWCNAVAGAHSRLFKIGGAYRDTSMH